MNTDPKAPVLDWVVLKIAQRCNLNCSYCYVYNRGDNSWMSRPVFISEAVLQQLANRIAEQGSKYPIEVFTIELHGGEPLLFGKSRMQSLVDIMRTSCPDVRLKFAIQTNGLLLDQEWLELFERNDITFGLSLDGPPPVADVHRVRHDGSGSTDELLANIARLRAASPLFDELIGGVLCVIDPRTDGAEMVRWFVGQGFRAFDFLLPDGNYANPPFGWDGPEPYRRFLLSAFDEWYPMEDAPRIRTFEVLVRTFLGVQPVLDAMGGDLRALCVVESDGSIGVSDVARICGGKFAKDELNVFDHPLDMHADHYQLDEIQRPPSDCATCPYVTNTGGGYLPHRFDGESFDNPSIYCSALCGLTQHIYERLREDVPAELWKERAVV